MARFRKRRGRRKMYASGARLRRGRRTTRRAVSQRGGRRL